MDKFFSCYLVSLTLCLKSQLFTNLSFLNLYIMWDTQIYVTQVTICVLAKSVREIDVCFGVQLGN